MRVSPTRGERGEQGRERGEGLFHELLRPVHISSPLLIRGCGPEPEDTVLRLRGSLYASEARNCSFEAAALRFSAAAVLENLTVVAAEAASSAAAAVHHSKGALRVSKCCLVSYVGALSHLHAPLATSAVGRSCREDEGTRNILRVEETRVSRRRGVGGSGGSRCLGAGAAVRAQGSGALSSVRALPLPCGGALLWCEVDADKGAAGGLPKSGEGEEGEGEGFADALPTAAEVRAAAKAAAAAVALQASPAAPPSLLLPLHT